MERTIQRKKLYHSTTQLIQTFSKRKMIFSKKANTSMIPICLPTSLKTNLPSAFEIWYFLNQISDLNCKKTEYFIKYNLFCRISTDIRLHMPKSTDKRMVSDWETADTSHRKDWPKANIKIHTHKNLRWNWVMPKTIP